MDELVRQLAQNEWLAQQEKQRAETSWRSAWWETTFALAELSSPKDGFEAAMAELGQSRDHLAHRRRVGIAVDPGCRQEAHSLPPTFSLNWVREGRNRIDRKAIGEILAAEENHVSTREFIASVARPEVRRTPVPQPNPEPRQVTVTPVTRSWDQPLPPSPPPRPEPERVSSNGHGFTPPPPPRPDARPPVTMPVSHEHSYTPPPPSQMALSAALVEVETINRAMSRLEDLIPKLDDETRPAFRSKLLELDVAVQVMVEGLNPESGMTFSDRDAQQLLSGG